MLKLVLHLTLRIINECRMLKGQNNIMNILNAYKIILLYVISVYSVCLITHKIFQYICPLTGANSPGMAVTETSVSCPTLESAFKSE